MPIDFAMPQWFALTLLLPFLPGLKWWSRLRSNRALEGIVARRLQPALVHRLPKWTDWSSFGLQLLALLAFITALARPQWGYRQMETSTEGRNVFLAIDTSRSMLAEDIQPNRLTRAKLAAQDIVRNLPADRIGVIAFAGKPFIQAPLTVDHDAVLESITQLDVEVIPRGGTNLSGPALLALQTMREAETSLAALVLFSDGEDHEGDKEFEQLAKDIGSTRLLVITVGVGTPAGGIIPDAGSPGQFIKDETGQIVRTRLNSGAMRKLSDLAGGIHVDMGGEDSVTNVVQQALRRLESQRLRAEDVRVPYERYPIPLAAGMILLLLSHLWTSIAAGLNRPRPGTASAAASLPTALVLTGLFWVGSHSEGRAAGTGLEAYRTGSFAEAQERFSAQLAKEPVPLRRSHHQFGLGAAAYRGGDLETAKEAFSQALLSPNPRVQEKAHYNLGNSLFESGRLTAATEQETTREHWAAAILHYESALGLNPDNTEAKTNRDFVQAQLDALPEPPPQEEEQEKPPEEEEEEEEEKEKEEEEEKKDEQEKQNPPDPDQEQKQDPEKKPDGGEDKPEDKPPGEDGQEPPPKEPEAPEPDQPEQDPKNDPEKPGQDQEPQPGDQGNAPPPQGREWKPSEARRILEQNADEDLDAKPAAVMQFSSEPFKNW